MMFRFTVVLLGETIETIKNHNTNSQAEAVAVFHAGKKTHKRGYIVDNKTAEILSDFGFGEE